MSIEPQLKPMPHFFLGIIFYVLALFIILSARTKKRMSWGVGFDNNFQQVLAPKASANLSF
jgi:hypothetical protein